MKFDSFQAAYHWLLKVVDAEPTVMPTIRKIKSKESHGIQFVLTKPEDVIIRSGARHVDYEFASQYCKWFLYDKAEDWTKLSEKWPHVAAFRETEELPATYTNSYAYRIQQQLPRIIQLLKDDPENRRAYIHILKDEDRIILDHPGITTEYPCTIGFEFLLREGKLHMFTQMRSQNVCKTIIYDVYNFTTLQLHIAGKLKVDLGEYHHYMVSAHFFDHEQPLVSKILDEYDERN